MTLQHAPASALRRIADELERDTQARKKLAHDAARSRRYRKRLSEAAAILAHHLDGRDDETALEITALEMRCHPDQLRPILHHARRKLKSWQRWDRDRDILSMAERGISNVEIAAAFGLSKGYVGKIVKNRFFRSDASGAPRMRK